MINNVNLLKYNQISSASSKNTAKTNSASSDFSNLLSNAMKSTGNSSLDDIFERAAKQYNVPVNLVKAVAKAESNFNANAVSSCGAQGVMQLMPSTARSLGVQDSFNAEQNIMGGAKYLHQLLNKYNGNTTLAVAAYNAGSGNVDKYGGVPPFKETQAYVKRVLGYAGADVSVPVTQTKNNSAYASEYSSLTPLSSLYSALSNSDDTTANLTSGLISSLGTNSTTSNSSYLNLIQLLLAQMQANSSSYTNFSDSDTSENSNNNYLGLVQSMLSQMQTSSSATSDSSGIYDTSNLSGGTYDDSYLNLAQSMLSQIGTSSDSSDSSDSSQSNSKMYGLL